MQSIKPSLTNPFNYNKASSYKNKSRPIIDTVKAKKMRFSENINKMDKSLDKFIKRAQENRDMLDNITKTPEYLKMKANTLFGKKGPIK